MQLSEMFILLGFKVNDAQIKHAEQSFEKIKTKIYEIGAVAAGAVTGLAVLANSAANDSAEFSKLATIMGVSAEEAQRWAFAAGKTGTSIQDMMGLTSELAENVGEAAGGTGEAAEAFKSLGLETKDAQGNLREVPALMLDIADKFKGMKDGQAKTSALMGLFGEEGIKLVGTLNQGSDALKAMMGEADELGLVLGNDAVKSGVKFGQEMKTVEAVLTSLKNELGSVALEELNKLLSDGLEWWKDNKKEIKFWGGVLIKAVMIVGKIVFRVFKTIYRVIDFVIDQWRLFALIITSAVIVAMVLYSTQLVFLIAQLYVFIAAAVAAGWASMIAWVKATAPLLPYLAALALMILILDDIWGWWNGKDSLIGRIIAGWKAAWDQFITAMMTDNVNDPWWLKAIKSAVREVKVLIGHLETLAKKAADVYDAGGDVADTLYDYSGIGMMINANNAGLDAVGSAADWLGITSPKAAPTYDPAQQEAFNQFAMGLMGQAKGAYATVGAASNAKTINNQNRNSVTINLPPGSTDDLVGKVEKVVRGLMASESLAIQEAY